MYVTQHFVNNKVSSKCLKLKLFHTAVTRCCPFAIASCEIVYSLNFPIFSDFIAPWISSVFCARSPSTIYLVYPEFLGCIHLEDTGGLGAQLERTLPTFNTISYFAASSQEPVLCLCYYPRHISIELSHCLHYVLMPPGFLISSPLYTLLLLLQLPHKSWVTYAVPVNSCLTACPTSPWLFSPLITPSTQPRINYQDDIWIAYSSLFFSFFFFSFIFKILFYFYFTIAIPTTNSV